MSDWTQIGSAVAQGATGIANAFAGAASNAQTYTRFLEGNAFNRQANMDNMVFNRDEAEKSRNFNAQEAQQARDFSERMSNSAYQRSRADMEKAGLNPILMANQGGAGTPSASQASGGSASASHSGSASAGNVQALNFDALGKTIQSAREQSLFEREVAQRDLDIAKTGVDTVVSQELAGLTRERGKSTALDNISRDAPGEYKSNVERNELEYRRNRMDKKLQPYDGIIERVGKVIGAGNSARSLARPGLSGGEPDWVSTPHGRMNRHTGEYK